MSAPSPPMVWHAVSPDAVLERLGVSRRGLSTSEAAERLERAGLNVLARAEARSPLLRFLGHINNVLIYVLLGAGALTAALGYYVDTGVILAVVVANAIIGFIQEGRAEQAMNAIRQMLAPRSTVLRDGERCSIDSAFLTPGDIVLLEAGERVPADVRLLEAAGLRVEEAILTGESVPVDKRTIAVASTAPIGDRSGMAFSGTLVAAGTGRGVVVATGSATEIGRISGLLSTVETLTTPLIRQMDGFARWLTILILLISGVLLVYGYFVGHMPFEELFMIVVGLAVAAIPEGLPAVLTITLAIGVQAMARRNAIIRRLPAIETLGSVSVICTDKTGTLTRNEMMVATAVTASQSYSISGVGYIPEGSISSNQADIDPAEDPLLVEFARAADLCNDAALRSQDGSWKVEGDPMEGALKAFARKIMGAGAGAFVTWLRLDTIPFDAAHRYMAVLYQDPDGIGWISAKGAPEPILAMCSMQLGADGQAEALDPSLWHSRIDAIAAQGQRVLALARREAPDGLSTLHVTDLVGQLVFVGLVGLIDPPRPESIAAVTECREAGIRVKMITGDHAGTAAAIARQIGLQNPDHVLTGAALELMDDAELASAVIDIDVFARTSPEHKLRLVTALQSHGLTIAMTGDGVNDAPALKRADAGIAMGRKGSEAAKEASDLVLADDNFASIVAAVREGRTVYDNIKKVISWTLPTNAGEAMTLIVALFLGLALPITAIQILWINLLTAVTLGIALAFEPTEKSTMKRPPRRRDEPLLTGELIWHVILVSTLFLAAVFGIFAYAVDKGYAPELARTMALNTLVVLEIFHLFFIRNIYGTSLTWKGLRGTRVVWICVVTITLAQLLVTYWPALQQLFGTRAVSFLDGILIVAVGMVFFAIIEAEKQLRLVFRKAPETSPQQHRSRFI
ncbi:cation-transporting P-type ATPase [Dokdonella immobilis]|uniref:Potassium and/or sodium efflux P-type ATPase n=1 Tax=Dokdonella immobilis TaxID=578942 RepID=A0A1I4ZA32_9GAMM|nr:cation-transporting P-type ATPase [Dokdonella immobilis]SFN47058.1 potassium and/or sodium efflux P-type ATPase [Dokdonella immobilis]